jgi:hypothetical protein
VPNWAHVALNPEQFITNRAHSLLNRGQFTATLPHFVINIANLFLNLADGKVKRRDCFGLSATGNDGISLSKKSLKIALQAFYFSKPT